MTTVDLDIERLCVCHMAFEVMEHYLYYPIIHHDVYDSLYGNAIN